MDKNSEENIKVIERMAKEPMSRYKNAEQALGDAMQAAEGDLEEKVEIAERVFEIALELPTGIAIFLGRNVFQQVNDFQTYRKIVGSDEFMKYAEKYHEHIPSPQ